MLTRVPIDVRRESCSHSVRKCLWSMQRHVEGRAHGMTYDTEPARLVLRSMSDASGAVGCAQVFWEYVVASQGHVEGRAQVMNALEYVSAMTCELVVRIIASGSTCPSTRPQDVAHMRFARHELHMLLAISAAIHASEIRLCNVLPWQRSL